MATLLIFLKRNHAWHNHSLNLCLICSYIWHNFSLNVLTKVFVQPSSYFFIETSHLICSVNQITGFYMKCDTGLKKLI